MTIETLLSSAGLFIGLVYVIGGLIVNLSLSQYGVTGYQVLRVKYLAVGLTFLLNFLSIIFLASVGAFFVAASGTLFQQLTLIASLIASVCLLWLWSRTSGQTTRVSWILWIVLGAISLIYPLSLGISVALGYQINFTAFVTVAEAILAGILSFIAQIYFYARRLYAQTNAILGTSDPIGMGIPVQVQLAGDSADMALLANLGMPILGEGISNKVLLVDETDTHYIVGIATDKHVRAIEIKKELIKAILYSR